MTPARRLVDDLTVMVAGQGGDGSLTVASLLGSVLGARGFELYVTRDVVSRTKGGHAAALLRGSTVPRGCTGDRLDVLVAFDAEAVERAGPRVAADGFVLFDSSLGPLPAGHLAEGVTTIEIPFGRLAVRDHRLDLYKNSVSFGVLARLLGMDDEEATEVVRARYRRAGPEAQDANLRALTAGFGHADANGLASGSSPLVLDRTRRDPRMLITGNDAIAAGFMAAGGRFFSGYPITPASEILTFLARHLPRFGGVTMQVEDELAAVNMALGAALTGTRSMTASSGPGIALMQEGISQAGSAEIPLVIVDCQRAGPSTGMPTKSEQSDLGMLVHGGNGDFPRIVLAPGDPTDCFELAAAAVGLSQRLQGPVYIALDQAVAQNSATVAPFDLASVTLDPGRQLREADLAALPEYRRYRVSLDGASAWAPAGTPGGMGLVTGNERNEWGHVSSEPRNRVAMMDKRTRKVEGLRSSLPTGRCWGDPDATVAVIGIGMELGPMQEASERLAALGMPVAWLHPRTLWPVLAETLEFIAHHERVYVVEHNAEAQLVQILQSAGASSGILSLDPPLRRVAVRGERARRADPGRRAAARGGGVVTTTYRPAEPIWCAGCGHFGVQSSLQRAFETLGIEPHQTLVVAGIGCSGTIQNNLGTYGYHALHGRALPTAIGAHLADPRLTVVAAGGDGDGYAIGMGHLVHAFRRNPSIAYVVMNNGVYGLTKGQPSPTAVDGSMSGPPLDAVTLGLALPATSFVARGFARRSDQLDRLTVAAIEHARAGRGFAFLEVLSPCVHYNDTYPAWDSALYDVDADSCLRPARSRDGLPCCRRTGGARPHGHGPAVRGRDGARRSARRSRRQGRDGSRPAAALPRRGGPRPASP